MRHHELSTIRMRPATRADAEEISALHHAAFGGPDEARLVAAVREAEADLVSLVAEMDSRITGHILFSPVTIEGLQGSFAGLAPMAVLPELQRKGIGSGLVLAGLEQCRAKRVEAVVVLGHPKYYPKFGFERADQFGLRCVYDSPPESFMALELKPGSLSRAKGLVHYHPAFSMFE